MWLGRDPAIIRDPACIAYLIYTAPASKQDPALIWTRLINGHIRYVRNSCSITRIVILYVRPKVFVAGDIFQFALFAI